MEGFLVYSLVLLFFVLLAVFVGICAKNPSIRRIRTACRRANCECRYEDRQ